MKTKLFITSLLLGLSLNLFAENTKMVKSQLKEATIFFNGAELTHKATVNLQKGETEIKITELSQIVDRNSIKIKTTNGVLVSAFEFSIDYTSTNTTPKLGEEEAKKLQTAIADCQRQIAIIDVNTKVNTQMLSVLQKSIIKNVEGSEQGLAIDDLVKTLDYYNSKSLELEKALRTDKEKKDELNKEISKLNARLYEESRSTTNNKASGVLKVNLTAPDVVASTITITYYTSAAGWTPYYDINVASTNKPVKFTTRAKVRQATGIDWSKIKLSLSTSSPSLGKVAPLFNAWFLQYYQPAISSGYGRMNNAKMIQNAYSYEAIAMDVDEIQEMKDDNYEIQQPTMDNYVMQSENELNITYNIDLPYSIPATGKDVNIELKNQEVPAVFKYYSAPKLDAATYVLAEIGDWQKLNLLSAKANVTYDGTFVGETYIDANSTHENLSLTLGSDRRVPVKREKQKDFSSTKFLGSDTKQVFSYKLTVRNNQNVPIKMVLKDQYPKSTTKEIEVEYLAKETTKPTHNIEDLGVVTWEFDMQPGEVRTFNFAYSVKYPKGKQLNL